MILGMCLEDVTIKPLESLQILWRSVCYSHCCGKAKTNSILHQHLTTCNPNAVATVLSQEASKTRRALAMYGVFSVPILGFSKVQSLFDSNKSRISWRAPSYPSLAKWSPLPRYSGVVSLTAVLFYYEGSVLFTHWPSLQRHTAPMVLLFSSRPWFISNNNCPSLLPIRCLPLQYGDDNN